MPRLLSGQRPPWTCWQLSNNTQFMRLTLPHSPLPAPARVCLHLPTPGPAASGRRRPSGRSAAGAAAAHPELLFLLHAAGAAGQVGHAAARAASRGPKRPALLHAAPEQRCIRPGQLERAWNHLTPPSPNQTLWRLALALRAPNTWPHPRAPPAGPLAPAGMSGGQGPETRLRGPAGRKAAGGRTPGRAKARDTS